MKRLRIFGLFGLMASAFFFTSCNSGDEKKTDEKTADTTAAATPAAPTAATPNLNPFTDVMTIKHKVANYAKWKAAYDSHDSSRVANGLHSYVVTRGVEDSNMVMVAMKMDDVAKAKAWAASPDLKARMKTAGVIGPVTMDYTTSVFRDTTTVNQKIRVMVKHKVKDWDAWKKVFDDHKSAREAAGLTDRVVSHAIGDDHDVSLVFLVDDMAKAKAFMNSQDLKDKMKAGGVEGAPSVFFYTVAEKY